jgi:hypothetical protein
MEKIKTSFPCQGSNPDSLVVQPEKGGTRNCSRLVTVQNGAKETSIFFSVSKWEPEMFPAQM